MNSKAFLAIFALSAAVLLPVGGAYADYEPAPMTQSPVVTAVQEYTKDSNYELGSGKSKEGYKLDSGMAGACGKSSNGSVLGTESGFQAGMDQALRVAKTKGDPTFEAADTRKYKGDQGFAQTLTTGQLVTGAQFIYDANHQVLPLSTPGPVEAAMADRITGSGSEVGSAITGVFTTSPLALLTSITGGGGCQPGGVVPESAGGAEGCEGGGGVTESGGGPSQAGAPGGMISTEQKMMTANVNAMASAELASDPQADNSAQSCNKSECSGAQASAAGEDALLNTFCAFDVFGMSLINVANEKAASPCSSRSPTKTYSNVVYMVQQMYKNCFIPMAILFLLPGALATNTKTLISFGFLGGKDEDAASPFAGIMRATIAIFLIPATQLAVSYLIDVGNSLQDCTKDYVSLPLIMLWAHEQAQTFTPDQQGKLIKNLPVVPGAPYLGKFAGMPIAGAQLEQLSGMYLALAELCNEMLHMLSIGLCVISAFEMVMACYLFLMGPLAAAFFAWPSVGRDLFRKAFSTWLDGLVVLSLWKFWWSVVLCCMTARLSVGFINPFDPFEVYYFIAFMCILMIVPFNPFDFKAGELVSLVLMKAEGVAAKVAQGGKGGGSQGKASSAAKGSGGNEGCNAAGC